MRGVKERFLEYVGQDTRSEESTGTHPSSPGQMRLAERLADELRTIGLCNVRLSAEGYVFGELPASPGCEKAPVLGWIAHMDTSPDASGVNVKPRAVVFAGTPVKLGDSGRTLDPAVFPELEKLTGQTLLVTDGTTLLGADDKAGVAEIMTALETLIAERRPHGALRVAFTPDEEIGEGTDFFDVAAFGADCAYTMDGGAVQEIEYRNFNAALATFEIAGRSVHPGSAKNVMINAIKLAMELAAHFPAAESPESTEGMEGFYHLCEMNGSVGAAKVVFLLRDHDASSFAARKRCAEAAAASINRKYGDGTVRLTLRDQYRNMAEIIERNFYLIEEAERAIRRCGLTPEIVPVRGGTDGATLSFRGLPCPNLGTGGGNYHGPYEYVSLEGMAQAVNVILFLIEAFSQRRSE